LSKESKKLKDECHSLTKSRIDEICAINRKYNYRSRGRSDEDKKRSRQLWDEIYKIYEDFNKANPLPPCKECGEERLAHLGGVCFNRDNCSLAIKFLGG
jgi:hypothetical protein